ncbi:MAG: hypothetical protein LBV44_08715 [Methylobacillus sp.]|jgi:hypothetical protein|nr:hypothetical protein [Methylobacillus sp.]
MIFFPMWSTAQTIIFLLSIPATLALVIGLALLPLPSFRRALRRHPKRCLIGFPLLALAALPMLLEIYTAIQVTRSMNAPESERHITLEHAETIQGFDLPAGTKLDLSEAYNNASFKRAEFPHPVKIFNVTATAMTTIWPYSVSLLTVSGEQAVDGWVCNGNDEIEFGRDNDRHDGVLDKRYHFDGCALGRGNRLADGTVIPENSKLRKPWGRPHDVWGIALAEPDPATTEENCLIIKRADRTLVERADDFHCLSFKEMIGDK